MTPVVIVVEDNELDAERIERLARKLDLDVSFAWAKDGVDAMNQLRASIDDLPIGLIVDLNMPRMGGWELVAAVRAQEPFCHLPISVCTTSAHPNDLMAAREAEVASYVVKPITDVELRVILNSFLSNYQAQIARNERSRS